MPTTRHQHYLRKSLGDIKTDSQHGVKNVLDLPKNENT